MDKTMKLAIIVICVVLLTGCWDKIEIEERSFVYGIAIDLSENSTKENKEIKLTQQFIIPENLSSTSSNAGNGQPYLNMDGTGDTVFGINRVMMREENLKTDVTHLKVVLFSENVAKERKLLEEKLDVFLREKDMRRGVNIAITTGDANEFLNITPENEKVPAEYISGLLENPQNFEFLELVVIGDLQEKLFKEESFPLPLMNVKKEKEEKFIDYEGVAVYNGKECKIVGNLKGENVKGLSFILGKKNTGVLDVEIEEKTSTFVILNLKSKITLENKDINNLKFTVNVEMKTELAEQYGTANLEDSKVIKTFEEAIAKTAEEKMESVIKKLQNELQTDILGIGNYLSHYHPKLWKKVKDDWEQGEYYFIKSDIKPNVKVVLQKPGSINRTTTHGEKK